MKLIIEYKDCKQVPIANIERHFLAEYRTGFKSIVFKMFDSDDIEWYVDDPDLVLNKIDLVLDFYFSNIIGNNEQKYFNLEEL